MSSIRESLRKFVPPWLADRGPNFPNTGFKCLYAPAVVMDENVEWVLEGIQAKLPGVGTTTALARIGRDRQIPRGLSESDEAYIKRLIRWKEDWKHAGSADTLLHQVRAYLSPLKPRMRLVTNNGSWYTLNSDDSVERVPLAGNFNWDNASLWARFVIVVSSDPSNPQHPFDRDGTWGDGEVWGNTGTSTWGSTATPDQVAAIRGIIGNWKSAESVEITTIISFDDSAFDPTDTAPPLPDGTWGFNGIYSGSVEVASRDARGIYWDGIA